MLQGVVRTESELRRELGSGVKSKNVHATVNMLLASTIAMQRMRCLRFQRMQTAARTPCKMSDSESRSRQPPQTAPAASLMMFELVDMPVALLSRVLPPELAAYFRRLPEVPTQLIRAAPTRS